MLRTSKEEIEENALAIKTEYEAEINSMLEQQKAEMEEM